MVQYGEWTSRAGRVHKIVTIVRADDVNDEMLEAAREVESGWFSDEAHIDWNDFFERLYGTELDSHEGRELDLGDQDTSPAMRKIQKYIRELRKMG